MCGVLVLASRFTSTTLKITHLPSGETTGSPTRLSFIMSSKVKGCLACATTGSRKAIRAREKRTKRRTLGPPWPTEKRVAGLVAPPPRPPLPPPPGSHQAQSAAFEVSCVAGGQERAAGVGDCRDLRIEVRDRSALSATPDSDLQKGARGIFVEG